VQDYLEHDMKDVAIDILEKCDAREYVRFTLAIENVSKGVRGSDC